MNAGKAVYGILSGTTAVTDIVGTRIFPEIAEQEAVTPFIVYQLQSVDPEDTHDGPSKLDEVRFEFLCYADSYNAAADLGSAVRGALDRVSGTYNGVNVESVQFNDVDVEIEYDPRRYSQVLKFTFRIKRDDIEIALGTPVTGAQLGDLSDVNVGGVTDNQVLSYDAATDSWVPAADAGGAEQLDDLSDVDAAQPTSGQLLSYGQGGWVTIDQDEVTLPIGSVTGLQAALDATPDALDDLTDVKIVGTPVNGEALVYSSGFWSRGTAGASTLGALTDVNLTTPSTGAYLQYDGANWIDSVITLPSVPSTYYHNRYATEAETLRAGATATVELYYTAQADGDGYAESAESDTATTGFDIRRKLYYSEAAQADPDTGTWIQFATIPDDTTFASAKATLLAYLKERTGGTVPISLKMTWEEVAEAPSFTGLLNETYGSGAAAAYSVRRLNGLYTGAAIQVERSSDNTTQDIGFDVDGNLDESALTTFCTGTVCKVRTWYDQSVTGGTGSGNDAVQTVHANQPTIYTGGAIVKENGRVAVDFDGSNNTLTMAAITTGTTHRTSFTVAQSDGPSLGQEPIYTLHDTVATGALYLFTTESAIRVSGSATYSSSEQISQSLATLTFNGTTTDDITLHLNGSSTTQATSTSTTINTGSGSCQIGSNDSFGTAYLDGTIQELIFYNSDKSADRTSIESNIGDYFTQNTPLLDTYTGAAAAYSLRKLRTAYSGSAIRVRRASDNTESDINFNVFGELDTVSLASFCSGTDGFVKTWYDQSGNANDATQTTTANQPKIYDSSTGVVTENGKPAVAPLGPLGMSTGLTVSADFTMIAVGNNGLGTNNNGGQAFFVTTYAGSGSAQSDDITLRYYIDYNFYQGSNFVAITSATQPDQFLLTAKRESTTLSFGFNGGTYSTASGTSVTSDVIYLMGPTGGGTRSNAQAMQEIIIYDSAQSDANRTGIESNINTFYSIY